MQVGQLVKLQAKKRQLHKKRDQLIRDEMRKRQKERVNIDQSTVKKGHIEKHKYIEKKKVQTLVEKTKKARVEIQDNANPNTYLSRTTNFLKILMRTQQKVKLDSSLIRNAVAAVNAYGIAQKEPIINFTLHFDKDIDCEPKPFLVPLEEAQPFQTIIIVLPSVKEKEDGEYAFQKIRSLQMKAWSHAQFKEKMNKDKIFSVRVFQQQIKCFVKFELMKKSRFYEGLLKKGVPIFPIDSKKVPFCLQQQFSTYPDYIEYLSSQYVAVSRSGKEQTFRLRVGVIDEIVTNVGSIVHELTAKLIQRSRVKDNRLVKVSVKTASSINFDIYQ